VLVVVDDALHAKLGGRLATTKEYVRDFWSAVNLRFQGLSGPAVELVVVGMEVGAAAYLLPEPGGKVDAPAALDRMGRYFYTRDRGGWDLVVTLTGQDLCRRKAGSKNCRSATAGYAYVGGACVANSRRSKVNSVALVQDNGGFGGVVVAAHEVAHLLGATHDGDRAPSYLGGPGAAACSWADGFIMSDLRRGVRGLAWSDCTQQQIRHFLSSPTAGCLAATSRAAPAALALLPSAAALALRVASPDEQCQREAGAGSRACFPGSRVCTPLVCLQPSTQGCVAYRPAVEGSACGGAGHCSNGLCVKGLKAWTEKANTYTKHGKKTRTTIRRRTTSKPATKNTISKRKTTVKTITKSIEVSTKKSLQMKKEAKPTFAKLTGFCRDESPINVRGIRSCDQLYRSFAFMFCSHERMRQKCCGSHAHYC
jgi:hypothetical protein